MSVFKSLKNVASSLSATALQSLDNYTINKDVTGMNNHSLVQFHINLSESLKLFPILNQTEEERRRERSLRDKQYKVSDEIIRRFNLYEDDISRFTYDKLHGEGEGVSGIRYALSYFPHKYRTPTTKGLGLRNSVTLSLFLHALVLRIEMPKTEEEKILKRQEEDERRKQKAEKEKLEAQERYRAYEASPEWAKRQADRKAKGLPPMKSSLDP